MGERLALHKFHDDKGPGAAFAKFMDRDDIRVVQPALHCGFVFNAHECIRRELIEIQDLERHMAAQDNVPALIDHAHAALAEAPNDLIITKLAGCEEVGEWVRRYLRGQIWLWLRLVDLEIKRLTGLASDIGHAVRAVFNMIKQAWLGATGLFLGQKKVQIKRRRA